MTKAKKLFDNKILDLNKISLLPSTSKTIFKNELKGEIINIDLAKSATLTYITFDNGKLNKFSNDFVANLAEDAFLKVYNIVTSDKASSINGIINLNGDNAKVEVINLLLVTKKAALDSFIDIYHNTKNTTSELANYAIAKDEADIILNNNATIKKKASKAIAKQKSKGLTLSTLCKIKALPNLYIDEYDVVANHACSIGSINKEDLFYLMSRGLTKDEASEIVVMGYVRPILDHIEDPTIRKQIEKGFAEKLLN